GNVAEQETTQPSLALPDTIHAVLTARMDRLSPVAKRVLQTAAIIGKEVPFSLLATITRLSPASLSQSLAQLQAAELLHEISLVPESVYAFKHIFIQETSYHAVLENTRRQQHLQIARVLAENFSAMVTSQPAWIAHQFTEAGCVSENT